MTFITNHFTTNVNYFFRFVVFFDLTLLPLLYLDLDCADYVLPNPIVSCVF